MSLFDKKKKRRQGKKNLLWVSYEKSVIKPSLSVRARSARSKENVRRATIISLTVMICVAVVILLGLGAVIAGRYLYSDNPAYTVKECRIKPGKTVTEELIREYLGISEGMNIFGFNMPDARKTLIDNQPNVRTLEISRRLPDTLLVELYERVPLARVSRFGNMVADIDGRVFTLRSGAKHLPMLVGHGIESLRPGDQVSGRALAGLKVIDFCEDPRLEIAIEAVDVRPEDYLLLDLDGRKSCKLSWNGMGERTKASDQVLLAKLLEIARTLRSPEGRGFSKLDATVDGLVYGR